MKRAIGIATLGAAFVASITMPANADGTPQSSDNVELISTVSLRWRGDESRLKLGPTYLGKYAFHGDLIVASVQGNHPPIRGAGDHYESGLATFRLSRNGDRVRQLGSFRCHSVGDLILWRDLVLQGAISSQEAGNGLPRDRCDRNGLRMIDVSNPKRPRRVAFLPVACGIGDQAIVKTGKHIYSYAPSTCDEQTETFTNAGVFGELSVFRIRPEDPARSELVGKVNLLPMNGCGEVAVTMVRDLAVCTANIDLRFGLLDISDPAAPRLIGKSVTPALKSLTSPTFTWDGSHLVMASDPFFAAGNRFEESLVIYNIEDVTNPVEVGTWKVPDGPGNEQNIYSIIPVPMRDGREIIAVAHGNRGFWLVDITDPNSPRTIAHHVPAPEDVEGNLTDPEETFGRSDTIGAYWYNGRFYVSDLGRLKVLRVDGFNRHTAHYFRDSFNPQTLWERFLPAR